LDQEEIFAKVKAHIAELWGIDEDKVVLEAYFSEDLMPREAYPSRQELEYRIRSRPYDKKLHRQWLASRREHLGVDPLDLVELIMGCEEEFGCEIPDEEAYEITTVGQLVDCLVKHVTE
jgi:acyl carrier protein